MLFLSSFGGKSSGASAAPSSAPTSSKDDAVESAKEWKRKLQKEMRHMDRDISSIKRQEDKAAKECKKLAKTNVAAARILAKEIARTRHTIERMYTAKAHLNSVSTKLQTSISMIKMQGCISKSTEIMSAMNKLVSVKEISEVMNNMAREMERAGLVDEIIGDTMDALDDEGIDAAADLEVDKIITELTADMLSPATAAPTSRVKGPATATAAAPTAAATSETAGEGEVDEQTQELMKRLQAL